MIPYVLDPNATLEDVPGSQNWRRTLLSEPPAIVADDNKSFVTSWS